MTPLALAVTAGALAGLAVSAALIAWGRAADRLDALTRTVPPRRGEPWP